MSGSSYWPRSAVNAYGIGAVLAHPGDGATGVEAAGERDPDALADRKRAEDDAEWKRADAHVFPSR